MIAFFSNKFQYLFKVVNNTNNNELFFSLLFLSVSSLVNNILKRSLDDCKRLVQYIIEFQHSKIHKKKKTT